MTPYQRYIRNRGRTTASKLLWAYNRSGFCGGAVFDKVEGVWVLRCCAPYLQKVLGSTPVAKMGRVLTAKGFTYKWLD